LASRTGIEPVSPP